MKLTELEPQFLRHELRDSQQINVYVNTIDEANGIFFLCPICFMKNNGPIGTHGIIVTFRNKNVPDELGSHDSEGKPSRWDINGSDYNNLTLNPSIDISKNSPGEWHGHITDGEIK